MMVQKGQTDGLQRAPWLCYRSHTASQAKAEFFGFAGCPFPEGAQDAPNA
jgi:hypothetical protein